MLILKENHLEYMNIWYNIIENICYNVIDCVFILGNVGGGTTH